MVKKLLFFICITLFFFANAQKCEFDSIYTSKLNGDKIKETKTLSIAYFGSANEIHYLSAQGRIVNDEKFIKFTYYSPIEFTMDNENLLIFGNKENKTIDILFSKLKVRKGSTRFKNKKMNYWQFESYVSIENDFFKKLKGFELSSIRISTDEITYANKKNKIVPMRFKSILECLSD